MACKICKVPLAEGDKHFGCLLHRECTRERPCSLDEDEPPSYWQEVEALLAAAKCLSLARKSQRICKTK